LGHGSLSLGIYKNKPNIQFFVAEFCCWNFTELIDRDPSGNAAA